MKNLLLVIVILLLTASCVEKGTSDKAKEDSARIADSIAQVEDAKIAAEQARLDSIRKDSINNAEADLFYNSLPNIKKLAIGDHTKITKYLHSLGFKGSYKELGKEEDWRAIGTFTMEEGQRKCTINAFVSGYDESYDITITGDDEIKDKYYKETKKIKHTIYDCTIKPKLKGNTIAIDITDCY